MFIRSIFLTVVVASTISIGVTTQPLPDSFIKKIDALFYRWNKPNSPGCAVGIVRNDSLIFSKGYGMADLEYGIPNTEETIFHMASVSKQFTAFAIVLLERQGKLRFDDDIRKYLPWFPDLKEKIAIQNLLNHTSGIRDQWQLLAIQGTRLDDVITQNHIIKILGDQQALNFKPGDQYSYSNSNFTLLAEIVKSISGQSLRQFTDSAIFKPLGMLHTHFHDDYTEIVNNRAYSYSRKDSAHYPKSVLSYSTVGATSLFTNVTDMAKWISNFYLHILGDQKDIDILTTKAKLNSGKELNYGDGIVPDTYNGWREFSHGGADAGFRTFIDAFPDLKMGFIVFANIRDFGPTGKAHQMADLFVKDTAKKLTELKKDEKTEKSASLSKDDSVFLLKYLGNYVSDDGIDLSLEFKGDKLYYRSGDAPLLMKKDSGNVFSMYDAPEIRFTFGIKPKDTTIFITTPEQQYLLKKYTSTRLNDSTLKAYTGRYYSPELDCAYGIILKDHRLYLTNNKYDDAPLKLAGPDYLLNDFLWMNHLMVKRNRLNQITGFEINSGRVMHLTFSESPPS